MEKTDFNNLRQALAHAETALSLNLCDQGLRKLPDSLANLVHLESLDISANPLRQLPAALFTLPKLRRLHIHATGMDEIPTALGQLEQLTELRLGGFDDFQALPEALASLQRLQKLDLTDANHLQSLPEWLVGLPDLQELILARTNKLANLAEVVARLPHLRRLVLDDVPFSGFPQPPAWLRSLQQLDLSRTLLKALPEWLGELNALERLDLDSNPDLSALPASLAELTTLRHLDIRVPRPLPLPAGLDRLVRLEGLALVRFGLEEVPEWIFELAQLTWLYLGLNPICRVAPGIARLSRLRKLNFGYNPRLAPYRQQLSEWLPECTLELTPLPAEDAVVEAATPSAPTPYSSRRHPSTAAAWPEYGSLAAWQALDASQQVSAGEALARALGSQFRCLPPAGAFGLPRLYDSHSGLSFVVVAGGQYDMGLRDPERQELKKLTKGWSAEARAHLRDLEALARPLHRVDLPPFLCTQSPVTAAQAAEHLEEFESAGPVCLFTPSAAADFAQQLDVRLLSEAEWEYLARRGGGHTWLGLEDSADRASLFAAAELMVEQDLELPEGAGFGVAGLAWGAWVEDAWLPGYNGAPSDGSARQPRWLPEVARGGALLAWPWQIDGEALLLHAAQRDRRSSTAFPLLLGRDLPPAV